MPHSNGDREASQEVPENAGSQPAPSLGTAAALIGGIALLQPELAAGMLIGAGVTMLSGRVPNLVPAFRPLLKAAVKAACSAAETVAEAAEEIQDLIAEARAEHEETPSEEPHTTH